MFDLVFYIYKTSVLQNLIIENSPKYSYQYFKEHKHHTPQVMLNELFTLDGFVIERKQGDLDTSFEELLEVSYSSEEKIQKNIIRKKSVKTRNNFKKSVKETPS